MILSLSLVTLLVVTSPAFAAVKGGRRIIQGAGGPQFLGGNRGVGGIKSVGGLGAGSAQYAINGGFGQRLVYRTGQSQLPYGLTGNDYYSYPASLLTAPRRVIRRKTVSSPNLSGLRPIGFSSGDAQVKTGAFGLRRNLYRSGLSPVPYGLMGMDYYSYPKTLLTGQRRLGDDFGGLGQTRILGGGSAFTAGDSQGSIVSPVLGDGYGQRKITTVQDPLSGQQVTTVTKSVGGAGLRGGQIILNGGPAIRRVQTLGGFGQRQVVQAPIVQTQVVSAPIVQAPVQAPVLDQAPIVQAPVTRVISRRPGEVFLQTVSRPRVSSPIVQQRVLSQPQVISQVQTAPSIFGGSPRMYYVDGGNRYMGIDIIGGSRIGDPRFGYGRLAYNAGRFANLGLNQVRVPVGAFSSLDGQGSIEAIVAPSPFRKSAPLVSGFAGLSGAAPSKTITQEETVGPLGDRQVVTTVTKSGGSGLGSGKIGGLAAGGLAGVGQGAIVTQEEVVGPAGTPQILTTVTNTGSGLGSGKIGGLAAGSPLGFAGLSGGAPSKTITQEETVGPLGDRQVVTTVTKSGGSGLGSGKIGGLAAGSALGLAGLSGGSGLGSGKIGGLAAGSPLGFAGLSGGAPSKTITQEEVVGPLGDRAVVTTVTKSNAGSGLGSGKIGGLASGSALGLSGLGGSGLGSGKIGGLAAGSPLGFAGLSGGAPSKTITQEEVVGPLGDRAVVTTVTKSNAGSSLGSGKIGGLASGSALGLAGLSGGSGLGSGKIGGLAAGSPLGFAGLSGGAPSKTITQEETVGPLGDRQVVTTVTKSNAGSGLGSGKIGGLAAGSPLGFAGLSGGAPSKTITQEETVGPLGDRQVVTTVTNSGSGLGSGKIGGLATGGLGGIGQLGSGKIGGLAAGGLAGVGQTQVVTQEQVVGPAGDPQILTTVTNTGSGLSQESLSQDAIESGLVQEAIGGNLLASPLSVQSAIDPLSGGGQVSIVDDVIGQSAISGFGGPSTQVTTSFADPLTGSVTKVTEVSSGGLAQQNIADALVQESISAGGIGGSLYGYEPRVSFLSQYPYDVPESGLLRSVLDSRPIFQQQQDEQILVK